MRYPVGENESYRGQPGQGVLWLSRVSAMSAINTTASDVGNQ